MRKIPFANGEFYHVFNRGADKRDIFSDKFDAYRFLECMEAFNSIEPVGSIRDYRKLKTDETYRRPTSADVGRLVEIVAYCLNPNHYHFILKQSVDGGISEFMKKLGGGYTKYYNEKYERSGVLFQGRFKAVHISGNDQLLYDSAYVNLNNKIHKKFYGDKKFFLDLIPNRSSWKEYSEELKNKFCEKNSILSQFKDKKDYIEFAQGIVKNIKEKRDDFER